MSTTAHNVESVRSIDRRESPDKQRCRFCDASLETLVVDLGMSPLCETFLTAEQLSEMEPFYPLAAYVCENCFLVQVPAHVHGEDIFGGEYAYFSSFSDSWLKHASDFVDMAVQRFQLNEDSNVVEIASNDGYLLQYFVEKSIPAYGIEPAANVAAAAIEKGVPSVVEFFGTDTAESMVASRGHANLVIGNNVLAHVPDLNDFVRGLRTMLVSNGVISVEFPHLLHLIEQNQFDTIYQEHYCYFSLHAVMKVFECHGLAVFDVEEISTHGGSLRVFARRADDAGRSVLPSVEELRKREEASGLTSIARLTALQVAAERARHELLEFLIAARRDGKRVAGYGAPGKGNTLLNYCGVRTDLLEFVVDRNPYKHGRFLPGTHIPVHAPEMIEEQRPDYVLILPWNLKDEIVEQLAYIRGWGGQFVIPIPSLEVL